MSMTVTTGVAIAQLTILDSSAEQVNSVNVKQKLVKR